MRQLPSANQSGERLKDKNGVIAAAAVMLMLCPSAGQASDSVLERTCESEIAAVVAPPLPGNLFPPEFLNNTETPQWIPVPSWLSGTWRAESQLIVRAYDYRQHKVTISEPVKVRINRRSTIGHQRDQSGQVWHFVGCPYTRTVTTDRYIERQLIEDIRLISSTPAELVLQTHATISQVDKQTLALVNVFREETTATYQPAGKNSILVGFMVVDYDVSGSPSTASKSFCLEKRIQTFCQMDQDERGDLKSLFKKFRSRH